MLNNDMDEKQEKDLNLYTVFLKVCELKNYSDVAHFFHYYNRQAVSKKMAALAEQVGVKTLFIRKAHGVEPTSDAIKLRDNIVPILKQLEQVENAIRAFDKNSSGIIRLRCPSHVGRFAILKCVRLFREKYPNIKFEIKKMSIDNSLTALKIGKLDLVLTLSTLASDIFEIVKLHEYSNTFFATRKFLEDNGIDENVTAAQLKTLPVIFSEKTYFNHAILSGLEAIVETSSMEMTYAAVLDGMGIGYGAEDYIDKKSVVTLNIIDYKVSKSPLVLAHNSLISKPARAFLNDLINHFKIKNQ